uniref:Uncharacterized protein n=1 Tax=Arundo donax TaxID=35708 RepID=A0A0A8ZSR3_ARUDO
MVAFSYPPGMKEKDGQIRPRSNPDMEEKEGQVRGGRRVSQ